MPKMDTVGSSRHVTILRLLLVGFFGEWKKGTTIFTHNFGRSMYQVQFMAGQPGAPG